MSRRAYDCAVVAGAVVAYFAIVPDDLGFLERLSRLTQAIAPGTYALLIALVLVAGAVRIWGRQPATVPASTSPHERSGPT